MHLVSLEEFYRRLRTDPDKGLSSPEAGVRLQWDGPNALLQRKREPEIVKFLRQMTNLFALLLWVGAALSFVAEWVRPGEGNLYIAIAIVGVVLLNGSFTYYQSRKAEAIMASFRDMLPRLARVLRDGVLHEIPVVQLVRGDVIIL